MEKMKRLERYLAGSGKRILFLTTSNRWEGSGEVPKSSMLARELAAKLPSVELIDVSKLRIFPCEGNVSGHAGNSCGVREAMLKSNNPHKFIRCWASVNNPTDEMHRVANAVYEADIVVFFCSVRWGKMNSIYTQLMERLTWMENARTTLGEVSPLDGKSAGVVAVGHNWNGEQAVALEREVLSFFGFETPEELSFNWQFTADKNDETERGYREEYPAFLRQFKLAEAVGEAIRKFREFFRA